MYGPSLSDARKAIGLDFTASSSSLDFLYV
jgi:hypothetical protein